MWCIPLCGAIHVADGTGLGRNRSSSHGISGQGPLGLMPPPSFADPWVRSSLPAHPSTSTFVHREQRAVIYRTSRAIALILLASGLNGSNGPLDALSHPNISDIFSYDMDC